MPNDKKKFKRGKDTFEVPLNEIPDFLKEVPDAIEVKTYTNGKDTFEVPLNELNDFLKEVPNAKEVGVKKKNPVSEPPSQSGGSILQSPSDIQEQVENPFAVKEKPTNLVENINQFGEPIKFGGSKVQPKNTLGQTIPMSKTLDKAMFELDKKEFIQHQKDIAKEAYENQPDATYNTSTAVKKYGLTPEQFDVANNLYKQYKAKSDEGVAKKYDNFDDFADEWANLNKENARQKERENIPFYNTARTIDYESLYKENSGEKMVNQRVNEYNNVVDKYVPAFRVMNQNIDELKNRVAQGDKKSIPYLNILEEYQKKVKYVNSQPAETEAKRIDVLNSIEKEYASKIFSDAVNSDWNNKLIEEHKNNIKINRLGYYALKVLEAQPEASIHKLDMVQAIHDLPESQKHLFDATDLELYKKEDLSFNPTVMDDVVGAVIGIVADPLMYATGGIGSGAVKIATNQIIKTATKKLIAKGVSEYAAKVAAEKTVNTILAKTIQGVGSGVIGMGIYGGVKNAEQQAIYNPMNNADFSYSDMWGAVGYMGLLGGATGIIAPLTSGTKAFLKTQYMPTIETAMKEVEGGTKSVVDYSTKLKNINKAITAGSLGVGALGIAGEGLIFTSFGRDKSKSFGEDWLTQMAIIGVLHGKGELMGGIKMRKAENTKNVEKIEEYSKLDNNDFKNIQPFLGENSTVENAYSELKPNSTKVGSILKSKDVPLDTKLKIVAKTFGMTPTKIIAVPSEVRTEDNNVSIYDDKGTLLSRKIFDTKETALIEAIKVKENIEENKLTDKYYKADDLTKTEAFDEMLEINENYTKDVIETALSTDKDKRTPEQHEVIERFDKVLKTPTEVKEKLEKPVEPKENSKVGDIVDYNIGMANEMLINANDNLEQAKTIATSQNKIDELKKPILEVYDNREKALMDELNNTDDLTKNNAIVKLIEDNAKERKDADNRLNKMTLPELQKHYNNIKLRDKEQLPIKEVKEEDLITKPKSVDEYSKMLEQHGLSKELADANAIIFDTFAEREASRTGKSKDNIYNAYEFKKNEKLTSENGILRGDVTITHDENSDAIKKVVVTLVKPDASTPIHEAVSHPYLEARRLEAEKGNTESSKIIDDVLGAYNKSNKTSHSVEQMYGSNKIYTEVQEFYATKFEQYMANGMKSDVPKLQKVFDTMMEWFKSIYKNLEKTDPRIEKTFKDMLGVENFNKMKEKFDGVVEPLTLKDKGKQLEIRFEQAVEPSKTKEELHNKMVELVKSFKEFYGEPKSAKEIAEKLNMGENKALKFAFDDVIKGKKPTEKDFATYDIDKINEQVKKEYPKSRNTLAKDIEKQLSIETKRTEEGKKLVQQFRDEAKVAKNTIKVFRDLLKDKRTELKGLGINDRDIVRLLDYYKNNTPEKTIDVLDKLINDRDYKKTVDEVSDLQSKLGQKVKKGEFYREYNVYADIFKVADVLDLPKEMLKEFKQVLEDMTQRGVSDVSRVKQFARDYKDVLEKSYNEKVNSSKLDTISNVDKSIQRINENASMLTTTPTTKNINAVSSSINGFINSVKDYMVTHDYTYDSIRKEFVFEKTGMPVKDEVAVKIAETFDKYSKIETEADLIEALKNTTNKDVKENIEAWAERHEYTYENGTFQTENGKVITTNKASTYAEQYGKISNMNDIELNKPVIEDVETIKTAFKVERSNNITEIKTSSAKLVELNKKGTIPIGEVAFDGLKFLIMPDVTVNMKKGDAHVLDLLTAPELHRLKLIHEQLLKGNVPSSAHKMDEIIQKNIGYLKIDRGVNDGILPHVRARFDKYLDSIKNKPQDEVAMQMKLISTSQIDKIIGKTGKIDDSASKLHKFFGKAEKENDLFSSASQDMNGRITKAINRANELITYMYHGKYEMSEFKKETALGNDMYDSTNLGISLAQIQQLDTFNNTKLGKRALIEITDDLHGKQRLEFNKEAKGFNLTFDDYQNFHNNNVVDRKSPEYAEYKKLIDKLKNKSNNESFYLLNKDIDMKSDTFNFFDYKDVKDAEFRGKKGLYQTAEVPNGSLVRDKMIELNRKSIDKYGVQLTEHTDINQLIDLLDGNKIKGQAKRMVEIYKELQSIAEFVAHKNGNNFNWIENYFPLFMKDVNKESLLVTDGLEALKGAQNGKMSNKAKHTLSRTTYVPKPKDYNSFRVFEQYVKELMNDYYMSNSVKAYFGALEKYGKDNDKYAKFLYGISKAKEEGLENQIGAFSNVFKSVKLIKNTVTGNMLLTVAKPMAESVANPFTNLLYSGKLKVAMSENHKAQWKELLKNENSKLSVTNRTNLKEGEIIRNSFDIRGNKFVRKVLLHGEQVVNISQYTSAYISSSADVPAKLNLFTIEFNKAFKRLTDKEFDLDKYSSDASYRELNKDAIYNATGIAETRAEHIWLPTLQYERKQRITVLRKGKSVEINSNIGALANTVISFPIHQYNNLKFWTKDAIYNTNEGRASAIANMAGVLASGYIYSVLAQNVRLGIKYGINVLTGSDTDYEEKQLARLLDPVYHISMATTQFIQLPLAERSLILKPVVSILFDYQHYVLNNRKGMSYEEQKEIEGISSAIDENVGNVFYIKYAGYFDENAYGNKKRVIGDFVKNMNPYADYLLSTALNIGSLIKLVDEPTNTAEEKENKMIMFKGINSILNALNLMPLQKDANMFVNQEVINIRKEQNAYKKTDEYKNIKKEERAKAKEEKESYEEANPEIVEEEKKEKEEKEEKEKEEEKSYLAEHPELEIEGKGTNGRTTRPKRSKRGKR